jgi:hypothetical protein
VHLLGPDAGYGGGVVELHHAQTFLKKLGLASKEMKHASANPLHPQDGRNGVRSLISGIYSFIEHKHTPNGTTLACA